MAETIITSLFTRGGVPATNIETVTPGYPVARVWEIIDGSSSGDTFIGEFVMSPIEDNGNKDGLYKYALTTSDGYDESKQYIVRTDGGQSLAPADRIQVGEIIPNVLNEALADHLIAGSAGEAISMIKADTTAISNQLYLDADSVLSSIQVLLKLEAGRTRIDPNTKTLTIYDEDCATPLRVFELLDSTGVPSITEVCERVPIVKGVGDTTSVTDVCP